MSQVPSVRVRPRGRYRNIDADDTEIGYLTVTTDGQVDHVWAYEYGDRWVVDVVAACYRAVVAGTTIGTLDHGSQPDACPTADTSVASPDVWAQPLNE